MLPSVQSLKEQEGQENQNTLAMFDLSSMTVMCEERLSKA